MSVSLRKKLILSYVFIAAVCVFLISVFANIFLESQFKKYIIENQEKKNQEIIGLIMRQYDEDSGWNEEVVQKIGINALENGLILKVRDASGRMIWNARAYNNGMCQQIIEHVSQNMFDRYPGWKGQYVENTYPVLIGLKHIGSVEVGFYGPFYYTDRDIAFLNTLNKIFMGVGIISVLTAVILGSFMARGLSRPISKVIKTSEMISDGNYSVRVDVRSNIDEIKQLTHTINNLAATLEKHEKLRKQLTQDIAHELRTPLTTLQGHMEAMIDGVWDPDEERLRSCHEEIVRISRLVGDIEKLTRYDTNNITLNKTCFDISQVIRGIMLNFQRDFMEKHIEFRYNGSEQIVEGDRDKISQVIINLISNALKYTGEGGKVSIILSRKENGVEIKIKDTGTGISEEDLPYIFERFYRADKSRNRLTGGAGIGLTITKSIVEAHGGSIRVNSKLGEGTEFTVILPIYRK
ncbi:sensor histidine kinase [Fonticella tunisiensis]|uniref:histidine kinase n=1 Tax=Fonticella tunisiensis TaxID=1096341 RepID=A0A4R7KL57_9CLOT|nr:ATP-binding protein [Fonticella tunisiensis]TDT57290.1 signal transduction histidine kinase [Fonticella tunisiensis]